MREEVSGEDKGRVCLQGKQGAFGPRCIRGGNGVIEGKSRVLESPPSGRSFLNNHILGRELYFLFKKSTSATRRPAD